MRFNRDTVIVHQFQRLCQEAPAFGEVLPDLHKTAVDKAYPFDSDIGRLLSWWAVAGADSRPLADRQGAAK